MTNRIAGTMLKDNLLRDGDDLALDTDLVYFDVANRRLGINKNNPAVAMDVNGSLIAGSMQIDGSTLTVPAGLTIQCSTNSISVTDSRIILCEDPIDPQDVVNLRSLQQAINVISQSSILEGDSNVTVSDIGAGQVTIDIDGATVATIDGTGADWTIPLTTTGAMTSLTAFIGDINMGAGQISTDTGVDLDLLSGSGLVNVNSSIVIQDSSPNQVVFTNGFGEMITNAALAFDGNDLELTGFQTITGALTVDDLSLDSNSIVSTSQIQMISGPSDGITLSTSGNEIVMDSTAALVMPVGTQLERPTTPSIGAMRFNTDTDIPEIWDGVSWAGFSQVAEIIVETFDGDDSTDTFTLVNTPVSASSIIVDINGIVQEPGVAYLVNTLNSEITFTQVPVTGDHISVRKITETIIDLRGINDGLGTANIVCETGEAKIQTAGADKLVFNATDAQLSTDIIPSVTNTYDLGSSTRRFADIHTNQINSAPADVAERFISDKQWAPGTVVVLGEGDTVTACTSRFDPTVVGVVSTEPAYVLNAYEENSVPVALTGTVPCKVVGPVNKGDLLATCASEGYARAVKNGDYVPGIVFAKALEGFDHGMGIIKVLIWTA